MPFTESPPLPPQKGGEGQAPPCLLGVGVGEGGISSMEVRASLVPGASLVSDASLILLYKKRTRATQGHIRTAEISTRHNGTHVIFCLFLLCSSCSFLFFLDLLWIYLFCAIW